MNNLANIPFLELVKKRYSVRDYIGKPVEREKLDLCLEAARLAPSACNSQEWTFIIVDDEKLKNKLCDNIFSGIYKTNTFTKKAPVLVVVISEREQFFAKIAGYLRNLRFYLIDIGIAVEHFVLQAAELDLGTCWIGWFNEREAKKILNIPKNKKIDVVLSVGYPAHPPHPKKRKTREEISRFNTY